RMPLVHRALLLNVETVREIDQVLSVDAAVEVGVAKAADPGGGDSRSIDLPEAASVGGNREPLAAAWGPRRSETDVAYFDQRKRSRSEARPGRARIRRPVEPDHRPDVEDCRIAGIDLDHVCAHVREPATRDRLRAERCPGRAAVVGPKHVPEIRRVGIEVTIV